MIQTKSQKIWQGFHWSFFLNIQGLTICLNRFEAFVLEDDIHSANAELEAATELMLASGASMILAGSFERDRYDAEVRVEMMPPQVKSSDFSGLMSWEHSALVKVWQRLRPIFKNLPEGLEAQHQQFVSAYKELATAHRAVCEKFGGNEGGSLRFEKGCALKTLDKFGEHRLSLISRGQSTQASSVIN